MKTSIGTIFSKMNIRFGLIAIGFAIAWISFSSLVSDTQISLPFDSIASQTIQWFHGVSISFRKFSLTGNILQ